VREIEWHKGEVKGWQNSKELDKRGVKQNSIVSFAMSGGKRKDGGGGSTNKYTNVDLFGFETRI
jgi:hypothetical protein